MTRERTCSIAEHHHSCFLNIQLQERSPQAHLPAPALYKAHGDCQVSKHVSCAGLSKPAKSCSQLPGLQEVIQMCLSSNCRLLAVSRRSEGRECYPRRGMVWGTRKRSAPLCGLNNYDPLSPKPNSSQWGRSQYSSCILPSVFSAQAPPAPLALGMLMTASASSVVLNPLRCQCKTESC